MPYAIMRSKKIKTTGHAAASLKHAFREQPTDNADPSRTPGNQHYAAKGVDEAMGKLKDRLPEKRRKDAVVAVEYLMTASPEWWDKASQQQQQEWTAKSREWLEAKYGAENVVMCSMHKDELTPHLTALVVPMTKDGRLSASEMIGDRDQMKRDQTSYSKAVASLGLERGVEGSKAKHSSVKSYYARVANAEKACRDLPYEPQRPTKPAPAPEPPARHWWGAQTPQHKAWASQEAQKAKAHQDKTRKWQAEHKTWRSQVNDLAATALVLGFEAKQGRAEKNKATKASAAAQKAIWQLEAVMATPGVKEAVEAHRDRQEAQGRAIDRQNAADLQAQLKALEKAAEPEKKPPRVTRHYENDGPSGPGR